MNNHSKIFYNNFKDIIMIQLNKIFNIIKINKILFYEIKMRSHNSITKIQFFYLFKFI